MNHFFYKSSTAYFDITVVKFNHYKKVLNTIPDGMTLDDFVEVEFVLWKVMAIKD